MFPLELRAGVRFAVRVLFLSKAERHVCHVPQLSNMASHRTLRSCLQTYNDFTTTLYSWSPFTTWVDPMLPNDRWLQQQIGQCGSV